MSTNNILYIFPREFNIKIYVFKYKIMGPEGPINYFTFSYESLMILDIGSGI